MSKLSEYQLKVIHNYGEVVEESRKFVIIKLHYDLLLTTKTPLTILEDLEENGFTYVELVYHDAKRAEALALFRKHTPSL